jgi:hypothetical protein
MPTSVPSAAPAVTTPTTTSTTTPPPANTYAPTSAAAAAPAAAPAAPPTGSSDVGGPCPPSAPCSGDMTNYVAGLGACGYTDDGDNINIVALPWEMMGPESNDNPFCGRTISISYGGSTTTAIVHDKCMGCVSLSLISPGRVTEDINIYQ